MNELIEIILHTDDVLLTIVGENILYAYLLLFFIILMETGMRQDTDVPTIDTLP